MLDTIALILLVIGGINWGSIGIFQFDIVAWICGGQAAVVKPDYLYAGWAFGNLVPVLPIHQKWHDRKKRLAKPMDSKKKQPLVLRTVCGCF